MITVSGSVRKCGRGRRCRCDHRGCPCEPFCGLAGTQEGKDSGSGDLERFCPLFGAPKAEQPAMDLSRDKNAEEMKWSPLEMGAAMQAHGA